jgi:8-oxo-dGTP pyrophosphatase MutT (NUDIX family)
VTPPSALAQLRDAIVAHEPQDPREARSRQLTLSLLDWLPAPLDQEADPAHVTGSAIVLDQAGRVLLHRHKRLGVWLQPGGHLDPGENAAEAAVRETLEETGLAALHPATGPDLVHVDVHEGPRGHVHLDLRYLLLADGGASFSPAPGESSDVAWFGTDRLLEVADASLRSAVAAATARRTGT